jgi:pentose-5-phosphate-3-epimerase
MAITTIAPTILSSDPNEFKDTVQKYFNFAKRVHIDISDGTLTDNKTLNETAIWWPKGWTVDIHMMTANPAAHVDNLIKLHPNLVIFHAEAKDDLLPIFDTLKQNGMKVGVALVKSVYPPSIKAVLEAADHAMIFSGEMGKYGGTADILLLEKIPLIQEIHSGIEIGWDGGANLDNTHVITHCGVDVINVGSAISKAEDQAAAYQALNKATEKLEAI